MNILKKYLFNVRPALRPWGFLAFVYFFPVIIFGLTINFYFLLFPTLKDFYKVILACQGQILGMAIFQIFTCLAIIIFLLFKKSFNDEKLIKFKFKQFLFGIIFALFVSLNRIIFGVLGTGQSASFDFLNKLSFPYSIFLIFVFFTHGLNAGIIEEIIFRGIMQSYFKQIKGSVYSIFAISIAFMLPHIYNIVTLNVDFYYLAFIFFLSILLCSVREKYNNLSFCFGAHIFGNIFLTLILLFFSPNELPMEISRF